MTLTQCPYDQAPIHAEVGPTGIVVLDCPACGASWEYHTTWISQLRKPDRGKARAARRRASEQLTVAERGRT
jgi:hypothetical protein